MNYGGVTNSLKSNLIATKEINKSFKENDIYNNWIIILLRFPIKILQFIFKMIKLKINYNEFIINIIYIYTFTLILGPFFPDLFLVVIILIFYFFDIKEKFFSFLKIII